MNIFEQYPDMDITITLSAKVFVVIGEGLLYVPLGRALPVVREIDKKISDFVQRQQEAENDDTASKDGGSAPAGSTG